MTTSIEAREPEQMAGDFQVMLDSALQEIERWGEEAPEAHLVAQTFAEFGANFVDTPVGLTGTASLQKLETRDIVVLGPIDLIPDHYTVKGFEEYEGRVVVWLTSPKEPDTKQYGVYVGCLKPVTDIDIKRHSWLKASARLRKNMGLELADLDDQVATA